MYDELFAGRSVRVGVLRRRSVDACADELATPDSPAVVAFPLTSVFVEHEGAQPFLANVNHAVFFNHGRRHTRRPHDPRGDLSVCVTLARPLVRRLTGGAGALPVLYGPCGPRLYLAHHSLIHRLRSGTQLDPEFVEDTVVDVVTRAVADAAAIARLRRGRRQTTRAMHHTLVERTKTLLTERPAEPWTLAAVARELHTSAFHLARIFRASTGFSVHGYQNELRLRLALDLLDDAGVKVGELAHRLGYSSHSHFTDAFRASFGAPPAAVRGALGPRSRREIDRVLDGPLAYRL